MKKLLRKIRLAIGKAILDKKVIGSEIGQNPKIIVLQQDGKIGDYIVSSFIFRELKRHYPNSQVDVLCSPNNHNLFAQNQFVDRCYIVKRKERCAYTKIGKQLATHQYDVCINLPVLIRNRDLWLTRLIQAKNNIGYLKSDYALFNLNITEADIHFSDVYAKAIAYCGVSDINKQYEIPDYSAQKLAISQFMQTHQLEHCIAVNFFGAASSRQFSREKMHALLNYLIQIASNRRILLLTHPAVNQQLAALALKYPTVFVYQATQTIFDSIELMKYSEWVISPDTSIVHIASGLNKKIIGIYQTSDKENFQHWNPHSQNECHIISFEHSVNDIELNKIKAEWFN